MAKTKNFEGDPRKLLANKTVLVTGASSGIGREIAVQLAVAGACVLLHGRDSSPHLLAVKAEILTLGGRTDHICCDFTHTESLDSFVEEAWQKCDGIDGWINNAGGDVLTGEWANRSLTDKLQYLWQVDVAATLLLSRAVGKKMIQRFHASKPPVNGSASIVNIGWDQAEQGMAGDSGELFATTKGAIMAMSRSLAQSLAPAVRVNCVAPGWIQTKWGEQAAEPWSARAKGESLMNRWGTPQDVAGIVAFLCSDQASFISGQVISVNGGFRFS